MNIMKFGLITSICVSISMTSSFAQSREKLDASQFESDSEKIEKVETNSKKNIELNVCDADKKAEGKTFNEDSFLLRHKYYKSI